MVTIVIVNYNSGEMLLRCLQLINEQNFSDWELIIVDNASTDGSINSIIESNKIKLIYNGNNYGFAVAQNQGIVASSGAFIMPLNFDVAILPTYIANLVRALEQHPECGSVCGKILRMTPDWQQTNIIDTTGLIMPQVGAPFSRGNGESDTGQFDQSSYVFGAQGAAPLYRREMLDDISYDGQYFDEKYFMWYEDVDLDWRAQLRGWKCLYVPEAVAYHVGHSTDETRPDIYYINTICNRWMMIATNSTKQQLVTDVIAILKYEFGLLKHIVVSKKTHLYLKALAKFSRQASYLLRKRAWVQQRRKLHRVEVE